MNNLVNHESANISYNRYRNLFRPSVQVCIADGGDAQIIYP
jgi:hypothetical protein